MNMKPRRLDRVIEYMNNEHDSDNKGLEIMKLFCTLYLFKYLLIGSYSEWVRPLEIV